MKMKFMSYVGLVILLSFVSLFFVNGQLRERNDISELVLEHGEVVPQYAASCPNHDKHQMKAHGYIFVKNKNNGTELWNGQLYVCDCKHVVAIKGGFGPGWQYIGRYYRTWLSDYEYENLTALTYLYAYPEDIEETNNNYLEGYEFLF